MTKTGMYFDEKWWLVPWRATFCVFVMFAIVDFMARATFSAAPATAFFVDVLIALPELALIYLFAKKNEG